MSTTLKKAALKDASHLYEVERRAYHLQRPGFRISELQLSPTSRGATYDHIASGRRPNIGLCCTARQAAGAGFRLC